MAGSGRISKFRTHDVARQQGELARLRVVKGADRGSVFVIRDSRITVGRGEDSDVMIADLKASRLHAEITSSAMGWQVRDLGSANGILVNASQMRSSLIKSGDLITIGETVVEFLGAETGTGMLKAPMQATRMIEQQALSRQDSQGRARSLMDPFGVMSGQIAGSPAATSSPVVRTARIAALAAVAVAAVFMLSDGDSPSKKKKKNSDRSPASSQKQDLESVLPRLGEPARNKTAEMFFKQGFREYHSGNYLRAKSQFELVLQIVPDHEMARRYRDNCAKAIEDEVKALLETGRKALEIGRVREARGAFESVRRLLNSDQTNPAFIEAGDQLKLLSDEEPSVEDAE